MSMSRDEYQAVIDRTNQFSLEVAMQTDLTIADRIEELAAIQPDAAFIKFHGETITYRQVNERANVYAEIAMSYGVGRGDAVALMMENRPQFFYVWFGMLKLGICTALINTAAKNKAVTHAVTTVDSKLAFIGSECAALYLSGDNLPATVPTVEVPDVDEPPLQMVDCSDAISYEQAVQRASEQEYSVSLRDGLKNSDIACYIFTSGTTGLPKAAYITHSKWLSTGHRWRAMADIAPDDIFYCVMPIFHGAGLMSMFSAVLAVGSVCVLRRKFSARSFWKDVVEHDVTVFIYVGEICRYLVGTEPVPEEKQHKVRVVLGAGMGIDIWNAFVERFGSDIRIYEGWGSTESNCNMTNLDNTPGSCGRIPYWDRTFMRVVKYDVESETHIRDANGLCQQVDAGEPGELLGQIHTGDGTIVSPFDGYTDDAATSKKLLRDVFEKGDCWFSTGDLLRFNEDGYFFFVDRIGDTFRWKSENVSTTEVSQQLAEYRSAEIINVYGVQVPGMEGRAGMAAVVMADGERFDPEAFYQLAVDSLPPYAVPLFVRVLDQMDMTGSYKLRKVDLQADAYNPEKVQGDLYVIDHQARRYSAYSEQALEQLGLPVSA